MAKAKLVEIKWDANQQSAEKVPGGKEVTVHFNPESLKLSYRNQNSGGDQPAGSATQFVGSGTSKMSVELFFDTTEEDSDVRKIVEKVAFFIKAKPQPQDQNNRRVPPGVSFEWGSFIFRGVVDSMDETLDYFSEEGVPLRATIALSLSRQDIEFAFGQAGSPAGAPGGGGTPAGTSPLQSARSGDSLQKLAGRHSRSSNWQAIAAANNIDDPLRIEAGALIDINAGSRMAGRRRS